MKYDNLLYLGTLPYPLFAYLYDYAFENTLGTLSFTLGIVILGGLFVLSLVAQHKVGTKTSFILCPLLSTGTSYFITFLLINLKTEILWYWAKVPYYVPISNFEYIILNVLSILVLLSHLFLYCGTKMVREIK